MTGLVVVVVTTVAGPGAGGPSNTAPMSVSEPPLNAHTGSVEQIPCHLTKCEPGSAMAFSVIRVW